MTTSQELLARELAHRIDAAGGGLGHGSAQSGGSSSAVPAADLSQAAQAAADDSSGVSAIVVLRRFEPAAFARSSLTFALGLDAVRADAWFRAFTRTIFLTGNPLNLQERFRFDHVAADGSTAWFGPSPSASATSLRRLLKLHVASAPPRPPAVLALDVPGSPDGAAAAGGGRRRSFELLVATAGLSTADYLVHLNHSLAEAALTGTLRPGDRLSLRHVPRLTLPFPPHSALRVHRDTHDPARLRAYTCLCRQ